jgi:hypothetical protein
VCRRPFVLAPMKLSKTPHARPSDGQQDGVVPGTTCLSECAHSTSSSYESPNCLLFVFYAVVLVSLLAASLPCRAPVILWPHKRLVQPVLNPSRAGSSEP